MSTERAISAHHEAGHAVVALALRVPVVRASIKPRPRGDLGRVIMPSLRDQIALVQLYVLLAGPFAQRRFAPRSNWLSSDDFSIAEKMIFGKGSRGTVASDKKRIAPIRDVVGRIVDYFWIDIEAVAKALLKYETMSGDEITAAICAARRRSGRRRRKRDPPAFTIARR